MFLKNLFFSIALSNATVSFANPQFNSELAGGDANISNLRATKIFSYNPAILAKHKGFSFAPLFIEYNYNQDMHKTLKKVNSFERLSDIDKISEIENIVGNTLHLDPQIGSVFVWENFSFALVSLLSFDSTLRGESFLLLEADATEKVALFLSYGYSFFDTLNLGFSIKPSHKLNHHVERGALEILDNPKKLNPFTQGARGEGIGLDIGLNYEFALTNEQTLYSGLVIEDLGNTSYHLSKKFTPPPPDLQVLKLGMNYEYRDLPIRYLNKLEINYAYVSERTDNYQFVFPHRYGMSFDLLDLFTLSAGAYKNNPSFGLAMHYAWIEISYVNYYEISLQINKLPPDHRHGLALHLIF